MILSHQQLPDLKRQSCKDHCYKVITCMQYVHNTLGPAMPEYVYQEALAIKLKQEGFDICREYQHHPVFDNQVLSSYIKLDILVKLPDGNIIIECKSIADIGDREQVQTFGYLCGTQFPYALLVNFGTYPKAQIERYYYDTEANIISSF